jgi:hypothetical protein
MALRLKSHDRQRRRSALAWQGSKGGGAAPGKIADANRAAMTRMNQNNNHSMQSGNALNNAVLVTRMEVDLAIATTKEWGEGQEFGIKDRVLELYAEFLALHNGGSDVSEAAATVASGMSGTVSDGPRQAPAPADDSNGAGYVLQGGKYQGRTVAQVYAQDPTYVTNFMANSKYDDSKNAARAFMATLGGEESDPYAA